MKVAIIGHGWVGKAIEGLFPDAYIYTSKIGTKEEVNKCDVAYICVPSPLKDRKLDTLIVEETLSWLTCPLIIIRSTVNVGDCDRWDLFYSFEKNIVFMPEYIGETPNHPLFNESERPFLIIGGRPENRRKTIELLQSVYNANVSIRQMSFKAAEVVKLSENRAIAWKLMECQELYDVCEAAGVDYYEIRDAVYGDDPRFNLWFTFVYPEKRGFNSSKCLVKDIPAWCYWAESVGIDPEMTKLLVKKSNDYSK